MDLDEVSKNLYFSSCIHMPFKKKMLCKNSSCCYFLNYKKHFSIGVYANFQQLQVDYPVNAFLIDVKFAGWINNANTLTCQALPELYHFLNRSAQTPSNVSLLTIQQNALESPESKVIEINIDKVFFHVNHHNSQHYFDVILIPQYFGYVSTSLKRRKIHPI